MSESYRIPTLVLACAISLLFLAPAAATASVPAASAQEPPAASKSAAAPEAPAAPASAVTAQEAQAAQGSAASAQEAPAAKPPADSGPIKPVLPPGLREVTIEQKLGAAVPMDLVFKNGAGKSVTLAEAMGGKATVLNLGYYKCPMLCTLVLNGLLTSLQTLAFDVGDQFRVVTLSIDPGETPELAAAKKKNALSEYGRTGAEAGWTFLTGDEASIRALADAVGFHYRYDPETHLYAHAAGIMVLTPQGKVARYFYGIDYAPRDMRLALVEASENRIGTLTDQVLLFCYQYDPASGHYTMAALNLVRAGAVLTILFLGTFILLSRRREAFRARPPAA